MPDQKYREVGPDKIMEVLKAHNNKQRIRCRHGSGEWYSVSRSNRMISLDEDTHFRIMVPDPEAGDGYELCEKDYADEFCVWVPGLYAWSFWTSLKDYTGQCQSDDYRYRKRKREEPEAGEGYELCDAADADEYCYWNGHEWDEWYDMDSFRGFRSEDDYRWRKRVEPELDYEDCPVVYFSNRIVFRVDGVNEDWQRCVSMKIRFMGFVYDDIKSTLPLPWRADRWAASNEIDKESENKIVYATHVRMRKEA